MNEQIRAPQLRVIDDQGKQLGVYDRAEALQLADSYGLDLVEISPEASPPVAKIVDWGKYNYQKTKQAQKIKATSKNLELKQIRLGLKIGENDLNIKINRAKKFLEAGHKVRVNIIYRGREQAHKEIGFNIADKIIGILGEEATIEQKPTLAGKQLSFVVKSSNKKVSNKELSLTTGENDAQAKNT